MKRGWIIVIALAVVLVGLIVWIEMGGINKLPWDVVLAYSKIRAPIVDVFRGKPTPTRIPRRTPTPSVCTVRYVVEGSQAASAKPASLTYKNDTGGTEQRKAQMPWSETFYMKPGTFAYISAQNGMGMGTINVEIVIDGMIQYQAECDGAYCHCHS